MTTPLLARVGLQNASHLFQLPLDELKNFISHRHHSSTIQPQPVPRIESQHHIDALLEERTSPGRGYGLYVLDDVPAFTCILADNALLSLAHGEDLPQLWEKYSLLSTELRQAFDRLSFPPEKAKQESRQVEKLLERGYGSSTAGRMARVSSIFQANAFKTSDPPGIFNNASSVSRSAAHDAWAYSLFPTVARINHSCAPNCHAHYEPASGQQVIYALQDLSAGSEIEISYFDLTMAFANRQARSQAWGFECTCPVCEPSTTLKRSGYEPLLATLRLGLCDISANRLEDGRMANSLLSDITSAIAIAEVTEHVWLRAVLPRLYSSMSIVLTALGRSEAEVESANSLSKNWELRITGIVTQRPALQTT